MKQHFSLALLMALGLFACSEEPSQQANTKANQTDKTQVSLVGPESTKSSNWKFVLNNAKRTIDKYAVERNPNAVFIGGDLEIDFILQQGGKYEGRYLLKMLNSHNGNTSFAMLLPTFDENKPSDDLNDESKLWEVVVAKYNGREF